jgi:CBS domain-containing protein
MEPIDSELAIEATVERRAPRVVAEIMTAEPVVIGEDTPLDEAAQVMDFYRVSGLPVCDASGSLVGVLSQTDVIRARATEQLWQAWPGLTARHLMSHPALTVRLDTPLVDAARRMEEIGIHRLVVVESDGITPIGVLSMTDLVHWIAAQSEGPTA